MELIMAKNALILFVLREQEGEGHEKCQRKNKAWITRDFN